MVVRLLLEFQKKCKEQLIQKNMCLYKIYINMYLTWNYYLNLNPKENMIIQLTFSIKKEVTNLPTKD